MSLVPGYYWLENWSGRRTLEKEVAEYAESGFRLEADAVLPAVVPDAENFCSTPLLGGAGWATIASLLPYRTDSSAPVLRPIPRVRTSTTSSAPVLAAKAEMHSIQEAVPVWKDIRAFLLTRTTCTPPADEPSDVRAVYDSMEIHRALFAELSAAALRPRAFFPPGPRNRREAWRAARSHRMEGLSRLLLLRARTAAILGQQDEATALAGVLWKLRSACLAESSWGNHAVANEIERFWIRSVRTILRASTLNDNLLKHLLSSCGGDWSPEKELQHSFHGEALSIFDGFNDSREETFEARRWGGFTDFQEKMLRFGPSAWVERNVTTSLRYIRSYVLSPLENGNFRDLPPAMDALDAEMHSKWRGVSPSTFLGLNRVHSLNFRHYVFVPCSVRLTHLAIAMERYRL